MNLGDLLAKRITRLGAAAGARAYSLYLNRRWTHPGTSITDCRWYTDFCAETAHSKQGFARFRTDGRYRLFVENNTADEGRYYLASTLDAAPQYKSFLEKFRTNDRFGGASTFVYGKHGRFSPTTLRYMKYLADCEQRFGSLDSKTVVEIGAGYGGLCKLFFDRFDLTRYYIVDLPAANELSRRYLNASLGEETVSSKVQFVNAKDPAELAEQLKSRFFDLGISTLGFSECARETQTIYIHFVLSKCNFGYLVMNDIARSFGVRSCRDYEIVGLLYKTLSIEEDPAWWWDDRVTLWTWKP